MAVQNNLDSIQGQQGLQLLGLPQVMELCIGTVIAGAPPSCPSLFRHHNEATHPYLAGDPDQKRPGSSRAPQHQ